MTYLVSDTATYGYPDDETEHHDAPHQIVAEELHCKKNQINNLVTLTISDFLCLNTFSGNSSFSFFFYEKSTKNLKKSNKQSMKN